MPVSFGAPHRGMLAATNSTISLYRASQSICLFHGRLLYPTERIWPSSRGGNVNRATVRQKICDIWPWHSDDVGWAFRFDVGHTVPMFQSKSAGRSH